MCSRTSLIGVVRLLLRVHGSYLLQLTDQRDADETFIVCYTMANLSGSITTFSIR